jgi:hypothetical protein
MNERRVDLDPLEQLRRADPVDVDRLSAELQARIRARVEEVVVPGREATSTGRSGRPAP